MPPGLSREIRAAQLDAFHGMTVLRGETLRCFAGTANAVVPGVLNDERIAAGRTMAAAMLPAQFTDSQVGPYFLLPDFDPAAIPCPGSTRTRTARCSANIPTMHSNPDQPDDLSLCRGPAQEPVDLCARPAPQSRHGTGE